MVLRIIGELHVTDLQIQIRKIFCTPKTLYQKGCEEMFFEEHDRLIGIFFNYLVDDVVRRLIGVER
jgi:hypothetical protein